MAGQVFIDDYGKVVICTALERVFYEEPTADMLFYYTLDVSSRVDASNVLDIMGNNDLGSVNLSGGNGMPEYDTDRLGVLSGATKGTWNNTVSGDPELTVAGQQDPITDFINSGSSYTVSIWFKYVPISSATGMNPVNIFMNSPGGWAQYSSLRIDVYKDSGYEHANKVMVANSNYSTYVSYQAGVGELDVGWHFIAFTSDGITNEKKLYVDGQLQSGSTKTLVWDLFPNVDLAGYYYSLGVSQHNCQQEELKWWDRVLSSSEISNLYGKDDC